jgi:hypothetical protein
MARPAAGSKQKAKNNFVEVAFKRSRRPILPAGLRLSQRSRAEPWVRGNSRGYHGAFAKSWRREDTRDRANKISAIRPFADEGGRNSGAHYLQAGTDGRSRAQ